MSIQSDVEMLSIQAMERYARRNHITGEEAIDIFHKYQVFEKILLQHEYLHQIGFEEVMEYVNQIIEEDAHKLIIYHGTTKYFDEIDLSKSHNRRDFGIGFYTTILENQAKEWAYRQSLREKKSTYYVNQYSYEENSALRIKKFNGLTKEWLEFIRENRSKGGLQHNYDVVIGPVADDNTMETIQLYISGILNVKEAIERLRYNKVNNQVSFHTEEGVKCLKLLRRECYE
ncbi:MAG: DUF3990 domain-containing protein [Lachnospiraceae bacterium]|nr:DUF3990 domain-containing protein [Lachnospiraceae bacterium]